MPGDGAVEFGADLGTPLTWARCTTTADRKPQPATQPQMHRTRWNETPNWILAREWPRLSPSQNNPKGFRVTVCDSVIEHPRHTRTSMATNSTPEPHTNTEK